VFVSSTSSANWTEVGPTPGSGQSGYLPNVAVTALGLFNSGGEELLRASTYGRGVWQWPIAATPDYRLSITNSPLTAFPNQTATFNGTASSVNGYNSAVTLSCVAGATSPPSTCMVTPSTLTPGSNTPFSVAVAGTTGDYNFNLQGVGSDANQITHLVPVTLYVVSFALSAPSPSSVTVPRGTTSSPVDFQVTAAGSFNQSVTVSCDPGIANATCTLTPGTTVNPTSSSPVNMTASVAVPAATAPASYTATIQATTAGAPAALSTAFTLNVTTNPDFILSEPSAFPEVNAGSTGTNGPISIASQDGFSGTVMLSCPTTYGANSCSISPSSVSSFPATATLTINGASFAPGSYSLSITGASGSDTHSLNVPFNVGDYSISGTQSLSVAPGGQGQANLTLTSSYSYSGEVNASCNASALSGAQCTLSPANPITVPSGGSASLTATFNAPSDAAVGNYNITINTQDTTGAPSHSFTFAVTIGQDFRLISSTASQTVTAGQTTGPYNLTIQPVGTSFNAAVTLACSGLPAGSACLFNPSTPVTPGNSSVSVVMTISTTAATAALQPSGRERAISYALWLLLPGIAVGCVTPGRRSRRRRFSLWGLTLMLLLLMLALPSCSGVSSGGGGCSSVPSVPTGLAASTTTTTGTTLSWTASTAASGCTITGYPVYKNGTQIATATGTNYNVTGLSPTTSYSFAVAATDSSGTSAQSAVVNVTTLPGGATPPGTYTITVTGTSPGAAPDPGQSTQVALVVN
jgi:hypothetical protein